MHNLTKIAAALLMLLGLALGLYAWMLSRGPTVAPQAANAQKTATSWPIVVAAKLLPAGVAIKAEDVRLERLTAKAEGSFATAAAVAGSVPAMDIGAGMPLSEQLMSGGLSLKVAEGERAVAIRVDEVIGVGNRVRPGDFVDVFLILKRDSTEIDRTKARLLLSRKKVLAYGFSSVDAMPSTQGQQAQPGQPPANAGGRNDNARTAVLAIPLDEVNQLALATTGGQLLLALRNPTDGELPDAKNPGAMASRATAGVFMAEVVGVQGRAVVASRGAAPLAGGARPRTANANSDGAVEVIRGNKREVVVAN